MIQSNDNFDFYSIISSIGFFVWHFLDVQNDRIAVNSQNAQEYSIKIDNTELEWAQHSLLST